MAFLACPPQTAPRATPYAAARSSRVRRVAALAVVLQSLCGAAVHAQAQAGDNTAAIAVETGEAVPTASAPPREALEHYQRGREHYQAGRYREALEELKAALAFDPESPNLLYNVARVHEDLGNLDDAIAAYEHYLKVLPSSQTEERAKTEKTIRRLEGAKTEVAARREQQGGLKGFGPDLPPPSKPLGRADLLFWTTAGAGVALLIGGGVTGWLALQRQNQVADFVAGQDGTLARRQALVAQSNDLALASDLMFLGGAVSLTTAALLFFLRDPTAPKKTESNDGALRGDARSDSHLRDGSHSDARLRVDAHIDAQRVQLIVSGSF